MALLLNKTLDNGVTGNYIRATGITIDVDNDNATIALSMYIDQMARTADKKLIPLEIINMPATDFAGVSTDWQSIVYNHIKTLDDYSGATDV